MDDVFLKNYLIDSNRISADEAERAEDYALTTGMGLGEAVVFLKLMNFSRMGQ